MRAAAGGALGREHFGQHAALGKRRAGAAGHGFERRVAGLALFDQLRARHLARIRVVQPGLVGEDDERVGFHQIGDQRAQGVVVADLDLVGDDGVVLVDHGDHAQIEQRAQRRARVEIPLPVGHVGVREQDLRGGEAVFAKAGLVALREPHLADGGGGLQLVDRARPLAPAQALQALGDGAAGHHQAALAELAQLGDLRAPARDRLRVQAAPAAGHQRGADLDHQRGGGGEGARRG